MGGKKKLVVQVCDVCGAEFPIWRNQSKLKDRRHVKTLYCHVCRERTPHHERRE